MKKTILITGASSGIGKATAIYFAAQGWQVCATMRNLDKAHDLLKIPNIHLMTLDVTDEENVKEVIAKAIKDFGKIDVLMNNAGYGLVGVFEAMSHIQIEKQFAVNLFGVMNMTKAVLPHFRTQGGGMIINISSLGGRISFPLNSIYLSTKWALEGFMESLQYEVRPFHIQIKNIEPGVIKTAFGEASEFVSHPNYESYAKAAQANMAESMRNAEEPIVVAKKVLAVAQDNSWKLRYVTGKGANILLLMRKVLPHRLFTQMVASQMEKGAK